MTPQELRALRAGLNATQAAMAKALGVNRSTYGTYEQDGTEVPRAIELACLWLADHPEALLLADIQAAADPDRARPADPAPIGSLRLNVGPQHAGVVEVAIATSSLTQSLIEHLVRRRVIDEAEAQAIYNKAMADLQHPAFGTGQAWTRGTLDFLRGAYQSLCKTLGVAY